MPVPLAHAGHILADLLYVAPVLIIVGWIGVKSLLDRRHPEREDEQPAA